MQGFFFFVNVCICFAAFVHFYISEEMCLFLPKWPKLGAVIFLFHQQISRLIYLNKPPQCGLCSPERYNKEAFQKVLNKAKE